MDVPIQGMNEEILDKYVTKPWDDEKLVLIIEELLNKYELKVAREREYLWLNKYQLETQQRLRDYEALNTIASSIAIIVHDLKNPLNFMEAILNTPERFESGAEMHDAIREQVALCHKRTMDLLHEVKRTMNNNSSFHGNKYEEISFAQLIEKIIKDEISCNKAYDKIQLEKSIDSAIYNSGLSRPVLSAIVSNLFSNALNATREVQQPIIRLSTAPCPEDDNYFIFNFADNGKGIPGQDIENVFSLGLKAETHGDSTGMGLSSSRNIIISHPHNGDMTVASKPGEGTTFSLKLMRKVPA